MFQIEHGSAPLRVAKLEERLHARALEAGELARDQHLRPPAQELLEPVGVAADRERPRQVGVERRLGRRAFEWKLVGHDPKGRKRSGEPDGFRSSEAAGLSFGYVKIFDSARAHSR